MKIKRLSRLNLNNFIRTSNAGFFEYDVMPDIPVSNLDVFYAVVEGDRPDLISYKFYNTVDLWWAILKANNIKFWGDVKVGQVIRIPNYSSIMNYLNLRT